MGEPEMAESPPASANPCLRTRRFSTNLTVHRGRAQIATRGDVDLATRDALREVAVDALGQPSIHELVLDLGSVTFLDASGLGCLVSIRNASIQLDRNLVLCNVPARILWLLELTDLLRHFTVETLTVPHDSQPPAPIQQDGVGKGFEPAHPATSAVPASAHTHEVQLGGHGG
jgi:anti-anti-sigma factor